MRPVAASDAFQVRSRKPSLAEQTAPLTDLRNAAPMSFFLRRASDLDGNDVEAGHETKDRILQPQGNQDTLDLAAESTETISQHGEEYGSPEFARRRSTIKAPRPPLSRRTSPEHSPAQSSQQDPAALTPLLLPSEHASTPSSPKSISSHSLRRSEEGSAIDETGSQAIVSSGEEDAELPSALQDSAPQLIMPSIKMPSRRPFTLRGKNIGRFKILVAGSEGTGKTSLIKSIVQLCEDIVHVDPFTPNLPYSDSSSARVKEKSKKGKPFLTEIYASTKPYPPWWTEVEDGKILRRRKSMGDAVLERNLCFVETSKMMGHEVIVEYMQQQLQSIIASSSTTSGEFLSLLSGRGGTQVDAILYLISKDTVEADCDRIKRLSDLANVIPLISKADLMSAEQISDLKGSVGSSELSVLPKLPFFSVTDASENSHHTNPPYTVSAATGRDMETMDASLLMSSEYVQPLIPSELALLVEQIFEPEVMSYLRHSAAKKLIAWHKLHPRLSYELRPAAPSTHQSSLDSPIPSSLSNSGVIVPTGSELSLTTSNSYALARLADHTQREERLAQVRLSKWASDLQISLQRERERYEKLARGDRALWLVEKMGEEVRDGRVVPVDTPGALVRCGPQETGVYYRPTNYATHDPLGLLRLNDAMRSRGWVAIQVVGSFGIIGGLALWVAKTWGFTTTLHDWATGWGCNWFAMSEC